MSDIITFLNGTLINRLEEDDSHNSKVFTIYDQYMLAYDSGEFQKTFHEAKKIQLPIPHNGRIVKTGDIIINMMTGDCVRVSPENAGSILPYNYTLIKINQDRVDADYLVYWMNHSPHAKSQFNQFMQGGSLVKKLTLNQLKQLEINLPSIERQQLIGKLAVKRQKIKYLHDKKTYLMDKYLSESLLREEN
ncbi:restriction endonuclease subunit S [Mammaliicoccus sp. JADD-157]|uniref:restriction endonuclease subunit S n=1 Tax=Mammaliicoccus sp. JADD-157 TaxID=3404818 RepID=UPI003BB6B134